MAENYIKHHGIKGMRWGVRRYQNSDGSLTPAGLKRQQSIDAKKRTKSIKKAQKARAKKRIEAEREAKFEKKYAHKLKKAELKEAQANAKKAEYEAKQAKKHSQHKESSTSSDSNVSNEKHNKKKKVSEMSDEELTAALNRIKLESEYLSKMNPKTENKGKKIVQDILTNAAKDIGTQTAAYIFGSTINGLAKKSGYKNATKTIKDENGVEQTIEVFEDLVDPRLMQKKKK